MPGWGRDDRKRLPEFYLSPAVEGLRIDPEVRLAMEKLWPWFWDHVGNQLGDPHRAADLGEKVAYGVTVYLKTHELTESLGALCRVAAKNFVETTRAREQRIEFRGLSQEVVDSLGVSAPDWVADIELSILVHQILQGKDREIRLMLELRLLDKTWDEVGKAVGMSGGQARLRLQRALKDLRGDRGDT
jgi:DNA-directed RNA polymerase specialized sigma24 family protein